MEPKEIKLSKVQLVKNIKIFILSSIFSFVLLLIIALNGTISPSNPKNKYDSDICYYGILSKDGFCNFKNDGTGESIKVYYSYTYDSPDIPTEKQTWINPAENEQWSIPETFFTKARKSSDVSFLDKFLVIYFPLILSENFLIWLLSTLFIFFLIRIKSKYKFKLE